MQINILDFYQYFNVEKIDYIELNCSVDASIIELYLINKYYPKYNKQGIDSDKSSLDIHYPNNWKDYPIKKFKSMLLKKAKKEKSIEVPGNYYEQFKGFFNSINK